MYRNRATGEFFPRFLSTNDESLIKGAIKEFERTLDDVESEPTRESFIGQFDDYKLGVCLYETLSNQFYPFPKLSSEIFIELGQYHLKLWNLVNEEFNGVVTDPISRKEVIERFRSLLPSNRRNLETQALNRWLFANYSHRQQRTKPPVFPAAEIVLKAVNYQIIKGILRYSQEVEINIPFPYNITSEQVKWFFFLSKRFGVFSIINKSKNSLKIKIIGPEELIGRRDKYGRKIQSLVEQLFKRRTQDSTIKDWLLRVSVPWGQKTRIVTFNLSALPDLPSIGDKTTIKMDFDSKTERNFFHTLKELQPWIVAREPAVLIENNQVFIPDFSLQFADLPPIYIEVVGFWTEDYKTKKARKLTEIAKTVSFPLILVVDSSLNFPKIPPFPSFEYKSDFSSLLVPLNNYLRETYLVPYEKSRILYLTENITTEIDALVTQTKIEGILPEPILLEYLGILKKKNIRQILDDESLKAYLKKKGWKYVPKIGLIEIKVVKTWRYQIIQLFSTKNQSRLDLQVVQTIFPSGLPQGLVPRILEYLGYKIQWQQLNTTVIRSYKKRLQ
jgi:predicted nuclease of restriction endonuclease-like RecB superfamily